MVTPDTTSSSRGFLKSGIGKRFQGARNQKEDGAENEAYSVVQSAEKFISKHDCKAIVAIDRKSQKLKCS